MDNTLSEVLGTEPSPWWVKALGATVCVGLLVRGWLAR